MRSEALSRLVFAERRVAPIRADREEALTLPDGRRLGMAEFGQRAPVPIVYLHGFLGSRLEPGVPPGHGANVIGLDRPGYGLSSPQPRPSLHAFGEDVRAGLDRLGIGRCVVMGASAGAPYALAVALALGERAVRLVLAGGIAGPEVLLTAGGVAQRVFRLARGYGAGGSWLLRSWLGMARRTGLDRTLLGLGIAGETRPLARHGLSTAIVHERLLQSLRTGNDAALLGVLADGALLTAPWDIAPEALRPGALVLHGLADPIVPPAHAHWYAEHLPGAMLDLVPGEQHLSLCFGAASRVELIAREAAALP